MYVLSIFMHKIKNIKGFNFKLSNELFADMINTLQNIDDNSQMSESGHNVMNNPNVYESNSNSHIFSSVPQSIKTISEMISVFDNPGKYICQLSTVMNIINSYCFPYCFFFSVHQFILYIILTIFKHIMLLVHIIQYQIIIIKSFN